MTRKRHLKLSIVRNTHRDIGLRLKGRLKITGRKEIIITSGENLSPEKIEIF